ncbi:MAG TPA: formate dehydrogenase accessory sulfurtransferase FdhD [Clostridia bacterium]|nr:formate dehydrogenase accessory sulfurtransferase FdhD [Clostridia bacterium]
MTIKNEKRAMYEEALVNLIVNNQALITFQCTPENLNELATGYLYSRGLIRGLGDILEKNISNNKEKIFFTIKELAAEKEYVLPYELNKQRVKDFRIRGSKLQVSLRDIQKAFQEMCQSAVLYKETGGIHCAALADKGGLIICCEDISRHNAVDKVIGKGLLMELDLTEYYLFTTGRMAADMVLKAVGSKVPMMVSPSIPSSMAVEIAKQEEITLVGRISKTPPLIYTYPSRIRMEV